MARLWRQIMKGEKGQALPVVLVLLVLGGLLIAPCLSYASTSLNAGRIVEENVNGTFAVDAGVEHVLWCIKNGISPPEQLPEDVSHMQVAIQTEDRGPYTLAYYGEILGIGGPHFDWLSISGEIVWDEVAEAYEYTITVTRQPEATGNVKLQEVGARLPVGYEYVLDSADNFEDNLSMAEPEDSLDQAGAHMLGWELPPPRPELSEGDPVATQIFYINGGGELKGDYTWVVAERDDVGVVGEVTGTLYRITATATRPGDGEITAKVVADAIWDEDVGQIRIIFWQLSPQ